MQHWQKIVRPVAWVILVLVLTRIGLRAAIESVTRPAGAVDEVPAARFDVLEQGVVVGPDDFDVAAQFSVHNAGQRRLVVRQLRRACCDPPGPEPLILDAGASGTLTVQTPAAELLKKGEFRQGFGTNDPRQPEVWLTLKLANEPTPAVRPNSESAAASPGRSVLVNKP
jgi:hypothetical protein